jgi:UDP-glucuronate 4-epimerase
MRVLLTGSAGFIGFHVAAALLARGNAVTGFDNVNAYYDPDSENSSCISAVASSRRC